ncbi:hypothetical protein FHS21_002801 [Phyllobacterium trifolii]|uniref:Uncharacterized protein n=1 Tax=Phyllobacterium trifolii TaxID=300193 RepID=A0A839U5K1_9HYPH|nr:hypothetical protein [Phyllobacterium trifolii]
MSKQPRLIVDNGRKKKGAPSNWRDGLKYQTNPKKKNVWAATAVLIGTIAFPFVTPLIIPQNASATAVAFVGQAISRQQLYVVDGDTIHYNREKRRSALPTSTLPRSVRQSAIPS